MHVSAGSNLTDTNVLVPMYHTPTVFMHVRFFFRDVCVLEFLPIQTRPQYFIKKNGGTVVTCLEHGSFQINHTVRVVWVIFFFFEK